jgi:predicted enzyme related to lactoylglutathione lyase
MPAPLEGAPVWADAMFPDVEAAKSFYAELFGWVYEPPAEKYGNYTQAKADGKLVAAVSPQMPDTPEGVPAFWNLYLATPDAAAAAERIKGAGGTVMMDPMQVGEFGTMVMGQDPGGVPFSIWQADQHTGFEAIGEPGAYCWAEVTVREPAGTDAFFPGVFPYEVKRMPDEHVDYRVWQLGGQPVLGRMKMTPDFPADVPPHINVYFAVTDCDAAVATVQRLGGKLYFGPMDSPFGRFATVADQQGAAFSVIDVTRTSGEMPQLD